MSWPILYKNFGITVMLCLPMAHINLYTCGTDKYPIYKRNDNYNRCDEVHLIYEQ